jgi:thiol-disulfide isomerase/thioredoxin
VLESPGGELPFLLELSIADGRCRAWIRNGTERFEVPRAGFDNRRKLTLNIDYYASRIWATDDVPVENLNDTSLPKSLRGKWIKVGRGDKLTEIPFRAEPYAGYRFKPPEGMHAQMMYASPFGKWKVKFSKSDEPAIGVFNAMPDGTVQGTFLTTGGDYRYLAGDFQYGRLRLSTFDGSHALLVDARMGVDGTLAGDLWSGDKWHDTWTATRADDAELPDAFSITTSATERVNLADYRFPDLDGQIRSLADVLGDGKVLIVEILGSWCPNCHDAAQHLQELREHYGPKGPRVVGLAFEYSGEFNEAAGQARKFAKRCGVTYPILLAGMAEKGAVPKALPFLKDFKAYPTTIVITNDGVIHAVHTGFSGPATGEAYERFRERFSDMIQKLLNKPAGQD